MQVVQEKEGQLRLMMRLHGVTDVVYWAVHYLYFMVLHIAFLVFTLAMGSALGLTLI